MVPGIYANYFLASTGASAALIGLLFVAISIAPERIFGEKATVERRAQAGSAFMALLNAFFVSLVALVPRTNLGYTALIMGLLALFSTLSVARHFWLDQERGNNGQRIALLLGSLLIYCWQIWYAVLLLRHSGDSGSLEGLAYLLLGSYGLGVSRAWELLGGQSEGLLSLLGLRRIRTDVSTDVGVGAGTAVTNAGAEEARSSE